ncbi:chaperone modulator CbpM [Porphyromonadaceae bacterium OttesenSCG-928-L07]|nr:chaperone modulator CbpM [Porphyromonadaceae bacterium OttesenSCG-928-L07]MDL2251241.1 chaperone modulator CbpM [Odoribacter sp. OttesenSCG-928-J03]
METELIIVSEYCRENNLEDVFINLLIDEGLLEVQQLEGVVYVEASRLDDIERFSRMYYDLSINIEGIAAINHMLTRMNELQNELDTLRKRMHIYEAQLGRLE